MSEPVPEVAPEAPEPPLSVELQSWALTQTGSVRALALLAAEVARQVEDLSGRLDALTAPPPDPAPMTPEETP